MTWLTNSYSISIFLPYFHVYFIYNNILCNLNFNILLSISFSYHFLLSIFVLDSWFVIINEVWHIDWIHYSSFFFLNSYCDWYLEYRTYRFIKLIKSVLSYFRLWFYFFKSRYRWIDMLFSNRKNESKHNTNQINLIFIFLFIIHLIIIFF